MMSPTLLTILSAVAVAAAFGTPAQAEPAREGDLRELRVGMAVAELPTSGYVDLACAGADGEPGTALQAWTEFARCPADASGLREIRFEYGPSEVAIATGNDKWEGTKVAGHPVLLSLLISDAGITEGIRILTDPAARPYMHKKAYLLGLQVKYRFSPETWSCTRLEPAAGERPVGGIYIKERCRNELEGRTVTLETDLYRTSEQSLKQFVNATRVEIRRVPGQHSRG